MDIQQLIQQLLDAAKADSNYLVCPEMLGGQSIVRIYDKIGNELVRIFEPVTNKGGE